MKVTNVLKRWISIWPEHFDEISNLRAKVIRIIQKFSESSDPIIRSNAKTLKDKLDKPDTAV